jgi:hypothetical protein
VVVVGIVVVEDLDGLAVGVLPRHALAVVRLVLASHELVVVVRARAVEALALLLQPAAEALHRQRDGKFRL